MSLHWYADVQISKEMLKLTRATDEAVVIVLFTLEEPDLLLTCKNQFVQPGDPGRLLSATHNPVYLGLLI